MRVRLDRTYTSTELAEMTGGVALGSIRESRYITTDSREVERGDIFVALRGENFDGNNYLDEAKARGAAILLCSEDPPPHSACVKVKDGTEALASLASAARERIAPTVIAVTGSVGKTTTKNMIASVLATHYRVHKTEGNHNNLLGTALTLLAMPRDTEIAVLELGMNHAGELAALSALVCPDVAVITNIGRAHIGNLGSRKNIARAKLEILLHAIPGAFFLYPADEELLNQASGCVQRLTVGTKDADCYFENLQPAQADFVFRGMPISSLPLPAKGAHNAACACYAVALGCLFGLHEEQIRQGLAATPLDAMRGDVYRIGGITVIEDCYNAAPESVRASCRLLAEQEGRRKIALLGDMLELGEHTRVLHEEIGEFAVQCGISLLFTFGAAAENYTVGARRAGMPEACIWSNPNPNAPEVSAKQLLSVLAEGDVLLIKASRALAAERIAALLRQSLGQTKG